MATDQHFTICHQDDCVGPRNCPACRRLYAQTHRPRYSELTPLQRAKSNCRSIANVAQRRGKLRPQPCEVCGETKVEKHHDDYSKPLQVRWLCRTHHRAIPQFHVETS